MVENTNMPFNNNIFFFRQIIRACLEAEKQRELALLALRRTVSCTLSSIKDDVSGQNSGHQITEIKGLKVENRELKLENAKLQSELQAMAQAMENQKATIEKNEEDLQISRRKSKMYEDHSSLLALHAHELSERKELLEDELEFREKMLNEIKVKNSKTMREMEEKYTVERRRKAVQMKEMEEAAAVLEKKNAHLKEELHQKDLQNEAKDIVSAVICNSLHESFNEDLGQCLQKSKSMEDELVLLKSQVMEQESKMAVSVNLLQESTEKCNMYEAKVSKLTLQLEEVKKAMGILENELVLKDKQIESMEIRSTEEATKLTDQTQVKIIKGVMKNESLEREVAIYRIGQSETKETAQEQQLLLNLKQATRDANLNPMVTTCENEGVTYQEEIQEMEMKIREGDERYSCILEKACLLDVELLNTRCELNDLKDQYNTKAQEIQENSKAHEILLTEQDDTIRNSYEFKSKLQWFMEKCCKLEEENRELEAKAEQLQVELDSREETIKQLDEQLTIFKEELLLKDNTIEQLSTKKTKRHGIRRFIRCSL